MQLHQGVGPPRASESGSVRLAAMWKPQTLVSPRQHCATDDTDGEASAGIFQKEFWKNIYKQGSSSYLIKEQLKSSHCCCCFGFDDLIEMRGQVHECIQSPVECAASAQGCRTSVQDIWFQLWNTSLQHIQTNVTRILFMWICCVQSCRHGLVSISCILVCECGNSDSNVPKLQKWQQDPSRVLSHSPVPVPELLENQIVEYDHGSYLPITKHITFNVFLWTRLESNQLFQSSHLNPDLVKTLVSGQSKMPCSHPFFKQFFSLPPVNETEETAN